METERQRPAQSFLVSPGRLYVATVALVAVATAVVAISNPRPEGACTGIGWGCSLYGWQYALVGLMFVGLPFLLVSGLAVLFTGMLPAPLRFVPVIVAWLSVAVPTYIIISTLTSGGFS